MTNAANKITVCRILLVPVIVILAYLRLMLPAFIVYVISCVSDLLDGYIARRYHQISDFGKFMDPLADKILVLSVMCYFVDLGQIPGWVLAIVLFREFAVSGLRIIALEQKKVIAAGISGKVKTVCTMICLGALLVFPSYRLLDVISCIIIVCTTLYSGASYFIANKDVLKS